MTNSRQRDDGAAPTTSGFQRDGPPPLTDSAGTQRWIVDHRDLTRSDLEYPVRSCAVRSAPLNQVREATLQDVTTCDTRRTGSFRRLSRMRPPGPVQSQVVNVPPGWTGPRASSEWLRSDVPGMREER
jgi:hypothetical protein